MMSVDTRDELSCVGHVVATDRAQRAIVFRESFTTLYARIILDESLEGFELPDSLNDMTPKEMKVLLSICINSISSQKKVFEKIFEVLKHKLPKKFVPAVMSFQMRHRMLPRLLDET